MVTVVLQVLSEDVSVETLLYKQSQLRYVVLFDFSSPPINLEVSEPRAIRLELIKRYKNKINDWCRSAASDAANGQA